MVPQRFVMRDRMPVTGNGKIDRRALRMPEESAGESAAA
jgi:acyl-coenzyme A synthetase/AMP-(fatty) acid ligase